MASGYDIYTDGSCLRNPGPGGWGAIIVSEDKKVDEAFGWEHDTTNQRMEILAAIGGLSKIPEGSKATVYSDSQYLIYTMTMGWKRRANQDLWEELDGVVSQRQVEWRWLRGHTGNKWNEAADSMAGEMMAIASEQPVGKAKATEDDLSGPVGEDLSFEDMMAKVRAIIEDEPISPAALSAMKPPEAGARMIDISEKPDTAREATARGSVVMKPETLARIREGKVEKGDVLATARVAGIMAAKRTPDIIPLCHPILLSEVRVDLSVDEKDSSIGISATVKTTGKTGAEMEALVAVAVAALTVYDMCKAMDPAMRIEGIHLTRKSGGKSGEVVLE